MALFFAKASEDPISTSEVISWNSRPRLILPTYRSLGYNFEGI